MQPKKVVSYKDSSILSNSAELSVIGLELCKNGVIRQKRYGRDKKKCSIYK